jgi:large subunit ribosomal protein L27Ae
MREFHLKKNLYYKPSINLESLWNLLPTSVLAEARTKKDQSVLLDVTKYGFFKVLGKGTLPTVPLVVRAKFFSKKAEERIKAVGGACVLCA